jgi:hypothetical protein
VRELGLDKCQGNPLHFSALLFAFGCGFLAERKIHSLGWCENTRDHLIGLAAYDNHIVIDHAAKQATPTPNSASIRMIDAVKKKIKKLVACISRTS